MLPAADRLRQALASMTVAGVDRPERLTVSALCQLANVSRNTLYRYHSDVLCALRESQQRRATLVCARPRDAVFPEQAELLELRQQIPKLVSLADHYYSAYREVKALLDRREQELDDLRRRLDSKPLKLVQ
jgi:hypothetical protein